MSEVRHDQDIECAHYLSVRCLSHQQVPIGLAEDSFENLPKDCLVRWLSSWSVRATPFFDSIHLTHVSCRVTESGPEAVNPQFRGSAGAFCSYSAEAGNRGPSGSTGARNSKRSPGLSQDSATRNRQHRLGTVMRLSPGFRDASLLRRNPGRVTVVLAPLRARLPVCL